MRNPACRRLAFSTLPCLLFLLLIPTCVSLAAPLFPNPLYPDPLRPGGGNFSAVVAADFNGDQAIDFAVLTIGAPADVIVIP